MYYLRGQTNHRRLNMSLLGHRGFVKCSWDRSNNTTHIKGFKKEAMSDWKHVRFFLLLLKHLSEVKVLVLEVTNGEMGSGVSTVYRNVTKC